MKIISSMKFLIICYLLVFSNIILSQSQGKYTIVIHGGAGYIPADISQNVKDAYLQALSDALNIGRKILESGGTSLDAVEQVIRFFEDDSIFNAGKGAVYSRRNTRA
jgi:beta-aspartyl-peptidase (threonine type)